MISSNFDLQPFNTFGISSRCAQFATFDSIESLRELLTQRGEEKLLILGGGSNVLLTKDFDGFVIKNEISGFEITSENENEVIVKIGAGVVWHEFVLWAIQNNFGGVENLSLIPGSVGASPMQNIGAYGIEIKDVFVSLEALNISTLEIESFDKESCAFGYRESVFKRALKNQYVIVNVSFRLSKKHRLNTTYGAIDEELAANNISSPTIRDVSNAVIAIRSRKLPNPKEIGNAGSFFKNPVVSIEQLSFIQKNHENVPHYDAGEGKVKLAAGWLIEQAGWKGKTIDNYGVHKNQALVLVNYGGCTGANILDLSAQIIQDIQNKFGILLEREVNII